MKDLLEDVLALSKAGSRLCKARVNLQAQQVRYCVSHMVLGQSLTFEHLEYVHKVFLGSQHLYMTPSVELMASPPTCFFSKAALSSCSSLHLTASCVS
jgi:hypothetical protein